MVIISGMIAVYGRLVLAGKYTVDETDTSKKQVPTAYVNLVCEWLASGIVTGKQIGRAHV